MSVACMRCSCTRTHMASAKPLPPERKLAFIAAAFAPPSPASGGGDISRNDPSPSSQRPSARQSSSSGPRVPASSSLEAGGVPCAAGPPSLASQGTPVYTRCPADDDDDDDVFDDPLRHR